MWVRKSDTSLEQGITPNIIVLQALDFVYTAQVDGWEKAYGVYVALAVKKITALDSIRGIAAFVVLLSHFAGAFFPSITDGLTSTTRTHYDLLIYRTPLSIFFSGGFAVIVFFVLSGFVLPLKYMAGGNTSLFAATLKRYVRLMPVALVSVLLGYFLMASHAVFFGQLDRYAHIQTSIYGFMFQPQLWQAIMQGLVGVFASATVEVTSYNPILWTIYYELLGAFLIFGLAALVRGNNKRWILYIIALIAFSDTYFVAFILGLVLADIYTSKPHWYEKVQNMSVVYKASLLLIALGIGAYQPPTSGVAGSRYWSALTLFNTNLSLTNRVLQLCAGSFLIILALSWVRFARIIEFRLFQWLGKISYTLYATHYILIYTLSSGLLLLFNHHVNYDISALLAFIISLPIMLGVATVLHNYVEVPSINTANKIGAWASK